MISEEILEPSCVFLKAIDADSKTIVAWAKWNKPGVSDFKIAYSEFFPDRVLTPLLCIERRKLKTYRRLYGRTVQMQIYVTDFLEICLRSTSL